MFNSSTDWVTLFHETSLEAANSIIRSQEFRPSEVGSVHNPLFGPGIYFATTINGAHLKSNHHGYCLSADVLIKKPIKIIKQDALNNKNNEEYWKKLRDQGYDAIYGSGMSTGDEVIVFDKEHVKNIKFIKFSNNSKDYPNESWNLNNILNTRNGQITLFYASNSASEAKSIENAQKFPEENGIFGKGVYLYNTVEDSLIDHPYANNFILSYADMSNIYILQPNEDYHSIKIPQNCKAIYGEVNSRKYFYIIDKSIIKEIHICGDLNSKKDVSCQVFVADLPLNTSSALGNFLRGIFKEYGIGEIIIRTKKFKGVPSSSYAFINFKSYEEACKAIYNLNYTKYEGNPIRLILGDSDTKKIIDSKVGNLVIKNLHPGTEVSQLHRVFSKYGDIISCEIPNFIKISGRHKLKFTPKNYGYVQFRNLNDAEKALKDSNNIYINGGNVVVEKYR